MSLRAISGEFADDAVTAVGSISSGPYVRFKALGGNVTVTTVGKPALAGVQVLREDTVTGLFTTITTDALDAGAVLIPYKLKP